MIEPKLDIVVPTHNNLRLTIGCLDCLYTYTASPFHLIIVDDSTDLTPMYIQQVLNARDNVTYIHSDEPYKCGNQIFNIALEHCKTPYLATIMNSIEVEPNWEKVALHIISKDSKVGTIGFKSLFADTGRVECAGIYINQFLPCDIGRDEAGHRLSEIYRCEAIQWAFALHKVAALKDNLSENTFHGFVGVDDIDNCFVLRSKGWKILYCGVGAAYHHPRATRGREDIEGYNLNRENMEAFYKRWGYWELFRKSNPEVSETLKDVKLIKDGTKMLEEELKEGEIYARSFATKT